MAQWENPWGYLPYGWGSGLLDYGTRWGGDGSQLSSTGTDRTGYEAERTGEGGNGASPSESSPFGGDTESGSYAMARDAASTLGKDMGAQALHGGLLGGIATDSLSGAAMGALGSAFGPGAIQGIANMGARATGFAPQTFAGKTLANVAPGVLGFLGGPVVGTLGLLGGSVLGGLAEDAMDARTDESRRDAYESDFGNIAGRQVYGNFEKALQNEMEAMGSPYSERTEVTGTLAALMNADARARQQYATMQANRGARDALGNRVSGGPFAGSDGFSIGNALSAGYNTGGYGQRNGGFSGGNAGNGQGYGGGNTGGNNSGGSQGGKNSQGEGYGGR